MMRVTKRETPNAPTDYMHTLAHVFIYQCDIPRLYIFTKVDAKSVGEFTRGCKIRPCRVLPHACVLFPPRFCVRRSVRTRALIQRNPIKPDLQSFFPEFSSPPKKIRSNRFSSYWKTRNSMRISKIYRIIKKRFSSFFSSRHRVKLEKVRHISKISYCRSIW